MSKKYSELTLAEHQKVLKLAQSSLPTVLISEVIGRSTNAVYDTLKKYGIPKRRKERETLEGMQTIADALETIATTVKTEYLMAKGDDERVVSILQGTSTTNLAGGPLVERPPVVPETAPAETRICIDCSREWNLTDENADWFLQRGLNTPRRCEGCRQSRRNLYPQPWKPDAVTMPSSIVERVAEDSALLSEAPTIPQQFPQQFFIDTIDRLREVRQSAYASCAQQVDTLTKLVEELDNLIGDAQRWGDVERWEGDYERD